MNREQVKDQIYKILDKAGAMTPMVDTEKIMLLFDEYQKQEPKEKITTDEIHKLGKSIVEPGALVDQMKRKGWTDHALSVSAIAFVDQYYPQGGEFFKIRKHFFNFIRYKELPADSMMETGPFNR